MRDRHVIARDLLAWYDANARVLPWRIPPVDSVAGVRPDPYRVWLSEIMLQQTTVAAVKPYFHQFTTRWPTVQALANANDDDVMAEWAGLGYYARARNLLKCAGVVAERGDFPTSEAELLNLPGIGPYTAAAISSIAFGNRAVVVDGNVERVVARLFDEHTPLPAAKPALKALTESVTPSERAGDFAQAMMDLGATICGRAPKCALCPIADPCKARAAGTATELPKKTPKPVKPVRRGTAYVLVQNGKVLLEKRPDKGLLGGMVGVPTTHWSEDEIVANPPFITDWIEAEGTIIHTFTHFHLEMTIKVAHVAKTVDLNDLWDNRPAPHERMFVTVSPTTQDMFPTVFKKIFRHGMAALDLL